MADLPFASDPALAPGLTSVIDLEGKLVRALEALGPLAGSAVAVIDVPGTAWLDRLRAAGVEPVVAPPPSDGSPLSIPVPEASLDAVVALWTAFRGVDRADVAEADRALRPGGRLLVVHDYGRDDVSTLRDPERPEYRSWSRREGPFLREGGFKIRVVHCFWTYPDLDTARAALDAFGERGTALAAALKRPRLSWNVAVYHRTRAVTAAEGPPTG